MPNDTKIKICGNTNLDDIVLAKKLGADFLGFIFAKSPRSIEPREAKSIVRSVNDFENFVGVFANQPKDEVEQIASDLELKWLQFHGEETSRYCTYFMEQKYKVIKSFRIKDRLSLKRLDEYNVNAFLFDTYSSKSLGGTGETFDWTLIDDKPHVKERLFLAGGLSVDNVQNAVNTVRPYAIDVASGVEREPGKKDSALLEKFIHLAKQAG